MTTDSDLPTRENPSKNHWFKGLYILLFLVLGYLGAFILVFVVILQFVLTMVFNTPNAQLLSFGGSLARYFQEIILFMTLNSEEKPFPFKSWP